MKGVDVGMGITRKRGDLTLFQNGIVCEDDERPWTIQKHEEFNRDYKWYAKKRPRELAAVLHNLNRLEKMLSLFPHPQLIVAGFIHPEPLGIWAIGTKDSQSADISRVTEIVKSILEN